jgi:hypothetical protein
MKIHKITSDFFWAGESKDSMGVPPGWVGSEADPVAGQMWTGASWVDTEKVPQPDLESAAMYARAERAKILAEEIDTMNPMRWASLSTAKKTEWTAYRQALLDVPAQEGFPLTITWPTAPTA